MSTAWSRWRLKLPKFLLCNFLFQSVFQLGIYWAIGLLKLTFSLLCCCYSNTHTRAHMRTHTDPHIGLNMALPDVWHFVACNGAKKILAGLY